MFQKNVADYELVWIVIAITFVWVTCVSTNPIASNKTDLMVMDGMEERKLLYEEGKELKKICKFKKDNCKVVGSDECDKNICPEETKGSCEKVGLQKMGKSFKRIKCVCTPIAATANSQKSVKSAWTTWLQNNSIDMKKYSEPDECNRKQNRCSHRCPPEWTGDCFDSRFFLKPSLCYCSPKGLENVESARLPLTTAFVMYEKAKVEAANAEAAKRKLADREARVKAEAEKAARVNAEAERLKATEDKGDNVAAGDGTKAETIAARHQETEGAQEDDKTDQEAAKCRSAKFKHTRTGVLPPFEVKNFFQSYHKTPEQ